MSLCANCNSPLVDGGGFVESTVKSSSSNIDGSLSCVRLCYTCHWFPSSSSSSMYTTASTVATESARCLHCTDVPCPNHAAAMATSLARSKLQEARVQGGVVAAMHIVLPVSRQEHVIAQAYQQAKCQEYMQYHKSRGWASRHYHYDSMMEEDTNESVGEEEENWIDYFQSIHPAVETDDAIAMEEESNVCETCHAGFPWKEGRSECDSCHAKSSSLRDDEATCMKCHTPTGAAWRTHCWPECYHDMNEPAVVTAVIEMTSEQVDHQLLGFTRGFDPDWHLDADVMRASKRIKTISGLCESCGSSACGPWTSRCDLCTGQLHQAQELTVVL